MEYGAEPWRTSIETKDKTEAPSKEKLKSKPGSGCIHPLAFSIVPHQMIHRLCRLNVNNNGFSSSFSNLFPHHPPNLCQQLDRPPISSSSFSIHTQSGNLLLLINALKHCPLFYFLPFCSHCWSFHLDL